MKALAYLLTFASVTLQVSPAAAVAATWKLVGTVENFQIYVADGTSRSGPPNSLWVMQSKLPPKDDGDIAQFVRLGSVTTLYEANCKRGQVRVIDAHFYNGPMGTGGPRTDYRLDDESRNWTFAAPGTVDEFVFETVCPRRKNST